MTKKQIENMILSLKVAIDTDYHMKRNGATISEALQHIQDFLKAGAEMYLWDWKDIPKYQKQVIGPCMNYLKEVQNKYTA